jgi:16S rRNA (guanine527-N7)-methyltransferase
MEPNRIASLLEPFLDRSLPPSALDQISVYIDLLLRWNARINLTAIRHPDDIVTRHFGESFFLARHLFPTAANVERTRVIDIGSGAGFPALPLKIWAPQVSLTLVESNHKKAAFLREVARTLTLTNINVIVARAETLAASANLDAEVVTFRAVERFDSILPVATKLLAPEGRLALLIGARQLPKLSVLAPNLDWATPIVIPNSQARVLSLGTLR